MQNGTLAVAASSERSRPHCDAYTFAIRRYVLLEQEDEQQLAQRWQDFGDREATDTLITSHLRLAAKVARRYKGYGLPLADIIAEANLGLVVAAARFEPGRGSRFSTYALWWMNATIRDYILRSWSLVRIGTTGAQRKLFFSLRREMTKLSGGRIGLTPELVDVIAGRLAVTPREVVEMDCRLNGDLCLNTIVSDDGAASERQPILIDQSPTADVLLAEQDEVAQQSGALRAALAMLTNRERRVLEARRLTEPPFTLDQLARELSISNEGVRQIEIRAFEKVKRAARRRLRPDGAAPLVASRPEF